MKAKNKPTRLTSELPPNPLPLPGQSNSPLAVKAEKTTERRVPARMKPGEPPLADEQFLMPWHLMWPD